MKLLISWMKERPGLLAVALILIASIRIVSTYRVLSNTTDEPAHLATGIEWIQNGTYTYEDQHPPLARVVGALGLYLTGSRWTHNKDMYTEGFLLLGQGNRYNRALFYSRLFMLPFFWVGSAAVYLWGFRAGGGGAAVLATLLFTTTPAVLAHAGLVTTDMALTAFVVATLLATLYWAEKPNWQRSALFGVLLGLALLSKFSSLAFLPVAWLFMYLTHLLRHRPGIRVAFKGLCTVAPWAAVIALISALVVWAGYRFDVHHVNYLNATLPAPAFFTGIRYVYMRNKEGQLAYLLGHLSQTGFRYYYPVVLAVKTPLATLILMTVAVWSAIRQRDWQIAMPLALVAAVLTVGVFGRINLGVRHILPIYAGIAICGGVALHRLLGTGERWVPSVAAVLLVWQILTGTLQHPDYIAYTNELAGKHPERILADSDLDWEQGMRGLALRLQELGIRHFTFKADSSGYMIAGGHSLPPYDLMPDGDQPPPGWSAVCVTAWKLSGQPKWAGRIEPTERIHRSIYLYYIDPK